MRRKLILRAILSILLVAIQTGFSYADDFKESFDKKYGNELLKEAQKKASQMEYSECNPVGERFDHIVTCGSIDGCIDSIEFYQQGKYESCLFHWPHNIKVTYEILAKLRSYRDLRDKIISDYKSNNFQLP